MGATTVTRYYINFYPKGVRGDEELPTASCYTSPHAPVHPTGVRLLVDVPGPTTVQVVQDWPAILETP
jgi:hypothetical protein